MPRCVLSLILAFIISWVGPALADQPSGDVLKAIVKIRATIPKEASTASTLGTEREGNGIVIDNKGHILTIGYLIVEAESIEVVGSEGQQVSATFVGYDHPTGFGILRADKPMQVEPMKLGQSGKVKEGDRVLVAGHGGIESARGARVISRKEFVGFWEYLLEDAIFTVPAYANFGGAALIDRDGRLLGIGSLLSQFLIKGLGSIPCNIFVPIDLLVPILDDLMTKGRSGKVPRPWLGIHAEEAHGRVFVIRVTAGGPAEKVSLQPGDIILTVNGKAVHGLADFYRKVWALGNAGIDVFLSILQGTRIRELTVRSGDRYQFLRLKPKKLT